MREFSVGVVGATGAVGQKFVELLHGHPWFRLKALGASEANVGRAYGDACRWRSAVDMPSGASRCKLVSCDPKEFAKNGCNIVFSGLDPSVAGGIETKFAEAGFVVFSNAKNHRYDDHVPILLPFVNPQHLALCVRQPTFGTSGGYIVTNANCATTGLCIALKPIMDQFGLQDVTVATMQAASGAGYPGLPAMDILDNVVPNIDGEEGKLEREPAKIFGELFDDAVRPAALRVTAMCHRVPVTDCHLLSASVKCRTSPPGIDAVTETLAAFEPIEAVKSLPSCPRQILRIRMEDDRPQPRLDRSEGSGMTTIVGRVRECAVNDIKLVIASHNTVCGGAGGSILNAEFAVASGKV
eukprot:Polyplicarium_translucidae@DN1584_c0_g1_i1.p1